MKKNTNKRQTAADMPVHLVGLILTFSNVVGDLKRLTASMEILAKKLNRATRNGTTGHSKP